MYVLHVNGRCRWCGNRIGGGGGRCDFFFVDDRRRFSCFLSELFWMVLLQLTDAAIMSRSTNLSSMPNQPRPSREYGTARAPSAHPTKQKEKKMKTPPRADTTQATHGRSSFIHQSYPPGKGAPKEEAFVSWLKETATSPTITPEERRRRLKEWERHAPYGRNAHPREEHLLPMHVAAGCVGFLPGELIFDDFAMGNMSLACVGFWPAGGGDGGKEEAGGSGSDGGGGGSAEACSA